MSESVARRDFIKKAGSSLAVAVAGGLVAASTTALAEENAAATSVDQIVWDEEYDVLIVGAGIAGCCCAATVALEGNGAKALMIDTGDGLPAGNSPKAGGRVAYTNDVEEYYTYLKALFDDEGTVSDEILHAYAEGAAENHSWFYDALGAGEDLVDEAPGDYSPTQPGCYPEYPELPGAFSVGNLKMGGTDGGAAGNQAYNAVAGLPIPLWLFYRVTGETGESVFTDAITYSGASTLTALVQDPASHAILGGVYVKDGKEVYVKAGAVIMCCGGFESNPKMRQNYLEMPNAEPAGDPKGNVGIGHDVCQKVGAAFWHMNANPGFSMKAVCLDGSAEIANTNLNMGIRVGINGRRYVYDANGLVVSSPDADIRCAAGQRHEKINWGGEWMSIPMPKRTFYICDQDAVDQGSLGEDPIGNNAAVCADTIEELAGLIDVPAEELALTVKTWNEFCAGGKDLAFYRPEDTLVPVATPPFYAAYEVPKFLNTDGGPERNEKGQVLDPDGEPIPNLYANGEFGSIWSRMYQGANNLGEGAIFGRITVRNALGIA